MPINKKNKSKWTLILSAVMSGGWMKQVWQGNVTWSDSVVIFLFVLFRFFVPEC